MRPQFVDRIASTNLHGNSLVGVHVPETYVTSVNSASKEPSDSVTPSPLYACAFESLMPPLSVESFCTGWGSPTTSTARCGSATITPPAESTASTEAFHPRLLGLATLEFS